MSNDNIKKPDAPVPALDIQKALTEGIAMGVAMGQKQQAPAPARQARQAMVTCPDCKQQLRACGGKHRSIAVYPSRHGRYFQGVWINGVRYLSNHGQHKITVPADSNIEYFIEQWETNEEEMNRPKVRNHNSGEISASGRSTFNPAGSDGSSFR